jgi:hypothetical protein
MNNDLADSMPQIYYCVNVESIHIIEVCLLYEIKWGHRLRDIIWIYRLRGIGKRDIRQQKDSKVNI